MKKMKKGEVHFHEDGNLVATVWLDKRAVAVLSTNADAKTGSVTRKAPGARGQKMSPFLNPSLPTTPTSRGTGVI